MHGSIGHMSKYRKCSWEPINGHKSNVNLSRVNLVSTLRKSYVVLPEKFAINWHY